MLTPHIRKSRPVPLRGSHRLHLLNRGLVLLGLSLFLLFVNSADVKARTLVLMTDWEPDDKVALHALAFYAAENELKLIGTTLLNSERKRVLVERTARDLGFLTVPVLRGSGGMKNDYPNIASSRQAREYPYEGQGILSDRLLRELEDAPRDGQPFRTSFEKLIREESDIEVVIMSAPDDIVDVLERNPQYLKNIKALHVMGGWNQAKDGSLRTTFNWNMGHLAAQRLLALSEKGVRIRLYSSHMIKTFFSGGSVSRKNMPELMAKIEFARSALRGLQDLEIASRRWDEEIIKKIPSLEQVIGVENIGRQITPADVALVISLFNQNRLEKSVRHVGISLDLNDLDETSGFAVRLDEKSNHPIEVVESVDVDGFQRELKLIFDYLPSAVETRLREFRFTQEPLNADKIAAEIKKETLRPVLISSVGQNITYIAQRLRELNPEKDLLLVDATKDYAHEFARMARRLKFRVFGFCPSRHELASVTSFLHFDDFFVAKDRHELSEGFRKVGPTVRRFYKPIGEEIFISFHTKNQSLADIGKVLEALARKHPNATLVHGFLPASQIHYLPDALRPIVAETLALLDRSFPKQVRMRNSYVGLGDTRQEMAERAARNQSPVYMIGDVSGGVQDEALLYLKAGSRPTHIPLEAEPEQYLRPGNVKKLSFHDPCIRHMIELAS